MSQEDDEDDDEESSEIIALINRESPEFIAFVNRILHLCEERWHDGEGDVPEAWFDIRWFIRRTNLTEDEIHRASEVAFRMFYEHNPEALDDVYHHRQFFIEDIIDDVIDSVTGIIFGGVPGDLAHGKSPLDPVFSHSRH